MIKQGFDKLNIYYKCSVLSGLLILVISLALIPLYFFNFMDIPLGLLLGGGYAIIFYIVLGIYEKHRENNYKWAVVISFLRYLLFAGLLVLVGLCYYKWDIKIFNIFSVVGGYLICLVVFILLFVINSRKKE